MTWVKLDDCFTDHPKIAEAGPLASWLYVCGLTYASRLLTDGFIPRSQVRRLADLENAEELAERLVSVGLWDTTDGGYRIHDYLDFNPSRDEVLTKRSHDLERSTPEYHAWRRAVLERDDWCCQDCGQSARTLHVHHLLPFAQHPDQRTRTENGVTLCPACHRARHSAKIG